MKEIPGYLRTYYHEVNKPVLIVSILYSSILVWLNYQFGMEDWFIGQAGILAGHFAVYMIAFMVPVFLVLRNSPERKNPALWLCILLAPLMFAIKVGMNTQVDFQNGAAWDYYWNHIIYWPLRMLVLLVMLAILYLVFHRNENHYYGLKSQQGNMKPYILMLLFMIPLIVAASTQPDFLSVYPKLRQIIPLPAVAKPGWFYKLLFELSYGTDFFSIEIFFRGFLVIGLAKWIGKDAILPMACFYCSIHFGKPLGECISSFFGGMLLGIISYHTRSIYGGLVVHLGIAWLMEIGGWAFNWII